jgi:hypothetical protein
MTRGARVLRAIGVIAGVGLLAPAAIAEHDTGPRWTVDTSGGRECSLDTFLPDVGGYQIAFRIRRDSALVLALENKGVGDPGGRLRIEVPGAEPWILDSKSPTPTPGPRDVEILAALLALKPVPMTFLPSGGDPVPFPSPTDNLAIAGPIFRACAAAVKLPQAPRPPQFHEVSYSVSERRDLCSITGHYQLHGDGIWLRLTTGVGETTLDVTRRKLRMGYVVQSLDLSLLGGPKAIASDVGSFTLDEKAFAALRADLSGPGRDFGITISGTERHTAQFGGKLAGVEASMFEACLKAKPKE